MTKERIRYYSTGEIRAIEYVDSLGMLHAEDELPSAALFWLDGKTLRCETWHKHGVLHRVGKPAFISYDQQGKVIMTKHYENGKEVVK